MPGRFGRRSPSHLSLLRQEHMDRAGHAGIAANSGTNRNSRDASRLFLFEIQLRGGLGLSCGQRLEAGIQAALVARNGVAVEDTLLHALVESGDGFAILRLRGLYIALGQGLAQQAEAAANTAAVGAIDGGAGHGLTGAFQRRYMICHYESLWFER